MNPNFSFFGHSALCCLTCGTALAYPALPGCSVVGFFGFEHDSGQGDLFEVYNRGQLLNQKRPLESQPASFMEAHRTNVGGYHSHQAEYPMKTLMPLPNEQKRQKAGSGAYDGAISMSSFGSTYANPYEAFMPPGLSDGIQVYVDNMGDYPGGFPRETHENRNHERLVLNQEDTNFPPSRDDAQGPSMANNPMPQPAPSQSFMEGNGPDLGGDQSYQRGRRHHVDHVSDGQKRRREGSGAYDGTSSVSSFESNNANSYQTFLPPDLQEGIQVYVDNMSVYPGGFPQEIHENINHAGLVLGQEDTKFPPPGDSAQGNSMVNNLETYWLSQLVVGFGDIDPKWHIPPDQSDFNSFSDIWVSEGGNMRVPNHTETPHPIPLTVSSKEKGIFTQESLQDFTPTTITHEAENHCESGLEESVLTFFGSKNVNRVKNQKKKAQAGVDVIPMASEEEVEECLMNIRFPTRVIDMSDQFVEGFIERFRRKLSELYKCSSNRWVNLSLPCKSIIRISQQNLAKLYIIRVPNDSIEDSTRTQGSTPILLMFVKLIEWLLWVNKLVLINMVGINMSYKDQYRFHQKLVHWLFDQAFNPEGIILPVLGFTSEFEGKDFGPIQAILSGYLSQTLTCNKALETSISIIKYYYKNIQLEDLKGIGNVDENQISNLETWEFPH
ncbi:hypothetical protein MJO28_002756 [Puccinia striiformis f. sp. tritici]|uniref:Uncharacterized protein n=1 Tax=Puccinia striiformis f. sp. tritici TaxID=168172 RepID=A0ACC0ESX0_9BASI|nr:hypothetical protein MJO28_002756 [Puccinia striiformis f. sp. tritici]